MPWVDRTTSVAWILTSSSWALISKLKDYRYEGWFIGAGVAYGYAWALSKHWNLEAELGVGYIYSKADKFNCAQCGDKLEDDKAHNYVGPTKAALNLVYVFKKNQ